MARHSIQLIYIKQADVLMSKGTQKTTTTNVLTSKRTHKSNSIFTSHKLKIIDAFIIYQK